MLTSHDGSPCSYHSLRSWNFTVFNCLFSFYVCFVDHCWSFCLFFLWSLCCLFFDLRILITPLVSSNSSCKYFQLLWLIHIEFACVNLCFLVLRLGISTSRYLLSRLSYCSRILNTQEDGILFCSLVSLSFIRNSIFN